MAPTVEEEETFVADPDDVEPKDDNYNDGVDADDEDLEMADDSDLDSTTDADDYSFEHSEVFLTKFENEAYAY